MMNGVRPVSKVRRLVYRLGFRPHHGNPLFSPSLNIIYGFKDHQRGKR